MKKCISLLANKYEMLAQFWSKTTTLMLQTIRQANNSVKELVYTENV